MQNTIRETQEKELRLTINYSFTYEVTVNTDIAPEIIKDYPKTQEKLPGLLVNAIEFPQQMPTSELVDKYVEVLEAVDVDRELWTV